MSSLPASRKRPAAPTAEAVDKVPEATTTSAPPTAASTTPAAASASSFPSSLADPISSPAKKAKIEPKKAPRRWKLTARRRHQEAGVIPHKLEAEEHLAFWLSDWLVSRSFDDPSDVTHKGACWIKDEEGVWTIKPEYARNLAVMEEEVDFIIEKDNAEQYEEGLRIYYQNRKQISHEDHEWET